MSRGQHNTAHTYRGRTQSRGTRLLSKLKGERIDLQRLERLLRAAKRDGT